MVEGHDEEHDEREENGLESRKEPVPASRNEDDDFSILVYLCKELGKRSADEVTDLEGTSEQNTQPTVLERFGLWDDVEEESGEKGKANEEDPEYVQGLSPELREKHEEGRLARFSGIQQERRVGVVNSLGVARKSRSARLFGVLVQVVTNKLETRHQDERHEAQKDHSSGYGKVRD